MRSSAIELVHGLLKLLAEPSADHKASGIKLTLTVDSNSQGIGCPLYMKSNGNLAEADADSTATMPCIGLALETGTGSKEVLLFGVMRDDSWNWTVGGLIYVSTTAGTLTQTQPSGTGDQVQVVGIATHADRIFFKPDYVLVEHA